jgi:hypothetical protein
MAMMDEHEFQRKSDAAFEALRRRLLELGDENEFEVEGGSGKLEIEFEDEDRRGSSSARMRRCGRYGFRR